MRTQWTPKLLVSLPLMFSSALMAQTAGVVSGIEGSSSQSAVSDLAAPELTAPTPGTNPGTVNQAFISQSSNTDVAYISQSGVGNYAAIYQSGRNDSVAIIQQTGNNGYAVIRQN